MNKIKIDLNDNEKNILTQLVEDYKDLYNFVMNIKNKSDRDIAKIDYILSIIYAIDKVVKIGEINHEECKKIEEYYINHTIELERRKLLSTYELEENEALEGIVNKINNSSTKL